MVDVTDNRELIRLCSFFGVKFKDVLDESKSAHITRSESGQGFFSYKRSRFYINSLSVNFFYGDAPARVELCDGLFSYAKVESYDSIIFRIDQDDKERNAFFQRELGIAPISKNGVSYIYSVSVRQKDLRRL